MPALKKEMEARTQELDSIAHGRKALRTTAKRGSALGKVEHILHIHVHIHMHTSIYYIHILTCIRRGVDMFYIHMQLYTYIHVRIHMAVSR